jgi:hypothetical protein
MPAFLACSALALLGCAAALPSGGPALRRFALDRAACGLGSSREELALALVDEEAGRADDAEHGFDPRSVTDLLGGIAGRGRQLEETVEDHLSRLGR